MPLVLHCPVEVPPVTDPLRTWEAADAQTLASAPAFTIGGAEIVSVMALETGVHPLVLVNVSVRVPAAISAALGV